MNISASNIGLIGIQKGLQGAQQAASEIVLAAKFSIGAPGAEAGEVKTVGELADAIVDLKINTQLVEVSSKVVKAGDTMMGSIIDIMT